VVLKWSFGEVARVGVGLGILALVLFLLAPKRRRS